MKPKTDKEHLEWLAKAIDRIPDGDPFEDCPELKLPHPHIWKEGWCRHCGLTTKLDRTVTDGAIFWKPLADGYEITVYAMTFGKARLNYGTQGLVGAIENGYCYQSPHRAIMAAYAWDGEGDPLDGWHRNPFDGRRRENGDPEKETRG